MLFTTVLFRTAVAGRHRSGLAALLALGAVIALLMVRDLSAAHVLAPLSAPWTGPHAAGAQTTDLAGRQADLMARFVTALGDELALAALVAGELAGPMLAVATAILAADALPMARDAGAVVLGGAGTPRFRRFPEIVRQACSQHEAWPIKVGPRALWGA